MKKSCKAHRFWIRLLNLILMAAMICEVPQAVMAAKNKATTIRLVRTEGKVTVKNSKKEELVQTMDMRLSSGDHQITGEKSYAWMSLDDTKAVKLDENSEAELRKKWRKLEVLLDSGSIFFNVTVPLEQDEELNIRSATIVTGIRGTCGWLRVMDGGTTRVYLLEGKLECVVTNPVEGGTKTITLKPGEYADFIVRDPEKSKETTDIVSGRFTEEDIEPYVLVELVDDVELVNKIYDQSGIDLRKKTGDQARKKLEDKQDVQATANKGIRGKAAEQDGIISKDPVWDDGDPDDSIVYLTMPQTATTVQQYLDMARVKKVVLLPGECSEEENALKVDVEFDVPTGKILDAKNQVKVLVQKKNSFSVDGTAYLNDDLMNEGRLLVKSSNTLRVSGVLYNRGHFENTATGRVVLSQGMLSSDTFINAGLIEAAEGVSGQALITVTGGTFTMSDGEIVSAQFDAIVKVEEGANAVLNLSGGHIANEREGAAALLVSEGDFRVSGLGTDVMGITDTLLGQDTDLGKYNAASVFRTDERYHLISLDSVESYPVVLGNFLHGTVTVPDRVEVGAKVTLTAIPDKGYQLESLTANYYNGAGEPVGEEISLAADQSFIMPNHDVIVNAIFTEQGSSSGKGENSLYQVKIPETAGGKVTANPQQAKAGEEVVLQVVVNEGYVLEKLSAADNEGAPVGLTMNGEDYVLSMPMSDVTVDVAFKALQYQVVFYDEDGKTILNRQDVDYGTVPVYKGVEPSKKATKKNKYVFVGWKDGNQEYTDGKALPAVTKDVSFTAIYREAELTEDDLAKKEVFTVNWVNWDGSILRTDKDVAKGTIPSYGAGTPTRNADAQYTYTFNGWNSGTKKYSAGTQLPAVTGNVTYRAEYAGTVNSYTVRWKNWDGTELKVEQVSYGKVPSYSGNTPVRASDAQYVYTFSGWSPAVVAVTGNVTYTATFSTTSVVHVSSVALNQKTIVLQPGGNASLTASILPDAAMNKNVSWSSTDSSVVSVSGNGLSATITAKKDGSATILVTTEDGGKTASCTVTVATTVTGVSLDKTSVAMEAGGTTLLSATVSPAAASNKNVTWSSSDSSVVSVSGNGATATLTAKKNGTATITVTTADGGKTASCSVTVSTAVASVSLDKTSAAMKVGGTATLTATVSPSTASNQELTWSSSDASVVSVSGNGKSATLTAKKNGTATITVKTADGAKTASCTVTVTTDVTGVTLNKTTATMAVGDTTTLSATVNPGTASNQSVSWSSSNNSVVSITGSGSSVTLNAKSNGSATITVTTADGGKTASCSVTVSTAVTGVSLDKTSAAMKVGGSTTLTATVSPASASNQNVTWSSSDASVVSITGSGSSVTLNAKKNGSATITVTTDSGNKTASCNVTVTTDVSGVSLNKTTAAMTVGGTTTLTATVSPSTASNQNVSWSSSDSSVVSVSGSGSSATLTAKKNGSATITVTTADGNKTASCSVTVTTAVTGVSLNKTAATMATGDTLALTATITPATASNQSVSWSSSNTSVATVSGSGLSATVTAKGYGTATIMVTTVDGSKTASCTVTIPTPVSSVSLNASSLDLKTGGTATLTATINPTSATNKNVSWSSNNTSVATVSSSGVVTAKGNGRATITVTTEDGGKTASCSVTVTTAVTGVSLNKSSTSMNVGGTETLTATVSPGTASNKNVTWSTSNSSVATVSSSGVVTGVAKGSATITVTTADGGKTASCTVTVIKPVTGITLSDEKKNLVLGRDTLTLTATVTPSDASDTSVTWSSSDTSVATVSNGKVTPKKAGTATITAKSNSDGSIKATCSVTVVGYTVSWYDASGVAQVLIAKDTGVAYGTVPSRSGPAKASTEQYNYTFNGWRNADGVLYTGALPQVTDDVSYYADYTAVERTFTVTWKDWDGRVLRTDTNVPYNTRQEYGDTSNLIRAEDDIATYTFNGWTDGTQTFGVANGYPQVKSDVTYTATYYANVKQYDYWFFYTISGANANGMQFVDAGTSITCPASSYKWKRQSDGAIFSPGDVITLTDYMMFDEYDPGN